MAKSKAQEEDGSSENEQLDTDEFGKPELLSGRGQKITRRPDWECIRRIFNSAFIRSHQTSKNTPSSLGPFGTYWLKYVGDKKGEARDVALRRRAPENPL
jgi:hypothetical protein